MDQNFIVAITNFDGGQSQTLIPCTDNSYLYSLNAQTIPQFVPILARSQSSVSKSLNTVYQISSSKDCLVNYSVGISCTMNISGGQRGTIYLEIASNSGFTMNVQEVCRFSNGNTGTLTIGLSLVQQVSGVLSGYIPQGYYLRLRTENNTGSPTFSYNSGQEVLL